MATMLAISAAWNRTIEASALEKASLIDAKAKGEAFMLSISAISSPAITVVHPL